MSDPFDVAEDPYFLRRFVESQSLWYDRNIEHIKTGTPLTRRLWVTFPRLRRLRQTDRSHFFGLSSLDAARAYLAHPVLGPRLRLSVGLVLANDPAGIRRIFPGDTLTKLHACLTVFARATGAEDGLFQQALDVMFEGQPEAATDARLKHIG